MENYTLSNDWVVRYDGTAYYMDVKPIENTFFRKVPRNCSVKYIELTPFPPRPAPFSIHMHPARNTAPCFPRLYRGRVCGSWAVLCCFLCMKIEWSRKRPATSKQTSKQASKLPMLKVFKKL